MRRGLGLSLPAIVLLAALAVPRVVTHDLGIFPEGSIVNSLLVFVPLVIWLAVVLRRRVPHPFLTLTLVGVAYGLMLAIVHQLLWGAAYGGNPPTLGGNLQGALDPGLESAMVRTFAFVSGLATGTVVGAIVGFMARSIERLRRHQHATHEA